MKIIGEKINGTRKTVAAAIANRNAEFIQNLAKKQADFGAHWLDVNAGTHPDREVDDMLWLIDLIQDQAGQKGTGQWTSANALELQIPIPTIDLAVMMRDLSGYVPERQAIGRMFGSPTRTFPGEAEEFIAQAGQALYGGMIMTYSQGFSLLRKASQTYHYGLNPAEVARIWRGGCIIRAALLEKIGAAYKAQPDLIHLLVDPALAESVKSCQEALRSVIKTAVDLGIPLPGLMASLAYYDSFRSSWLPVNLIQAQRDYFGAHTYKRVDLPGVFHTEWKRD